MTLELDTAEGKAAVLSIALRAAREASQIVFAGWRKHPVVEHKGAIDLVTSYDRESERFLRWKLLAEAPFAFVGEEEGGKRAADERAPTWFVDPLDGTTNFVHGHPFFCVSVGLLVGAEPLLGAARGRAQVPRLMLLPHQMVEVRHEQNGVARSHAE